MKTSSAFCELSACKIDWDVRLLEGSTIDNLLLDVPDPIRDAISYCNDNFDHLTFEQNQNVKEWNSRTVNWLISILSRTVEDLMKALQRNLSTTTSDQRIYELINYSDCVLYHNNCSPVARQTLIDPSDMLRVLPYFIKASFAKTSFTPVLPALRVKGGGSNKFFREIRVPSPLKEIGFYPLVGKLTINVWARLFDRTLFWSDAISLLPSKSLSNLIVDVLLGIVSIQSRENRQKRSRRSYTITRSVLKTAIENNNLLTACVAQILNDIRSFNDHEIDIFLFPYLLQYGHQSARQPRWLLSYADLQTRKVLIFDPTRQGKFLVEEDVESFSEIVEMLKIVQEIMCQLTKDSLFNHDLFDWPRSAKFETSLLVPQSKHLRDLGVNLVAHAEEITMPFEIEKTLQQRIFYQELRTRYFCMLNHCKARTGSIPCVSETIKK